MTASSKTRLAGRADLGLAALIALFTLGVSTTAHGQAEAAAPPVEGAAPEATAAASPAVEQPSATPPAPVAAPAATEPAASAPSAADAAAAAEAEAAAAAEAEALAAELLSGGDSLQMEDEPKISIYGFADFTHSQVVKKSVFGGNDPTFYVGNLNLYLASELSDNWRSLVEVRFMYLPNGTVEAGQAFDGPRTNTTVADYTDIGRPIRWGGVSIQRAWLEYSPHPLVTIRAGHWLTPYGIWNVDHGSPVIVGVRRPYVIGEALLPQAQTGLQLYGSTYVDATQFGYHLTLSNGRGPMDEYQDLDGNKAVGGRLFMRTDGLFGRLTLGASGYRGRYTDSTNSFVVDAVGNMSVVENATNKYDETSFAADLKWELGELLLQSEAIMNQVNYVDGARPTVMAMDMGPPGLTPDNRRVGAYGLLAYRTPWLNIMPFFGGEYYYLGNHAFPEKAMAFWGGLNVRPTPRVVLKGQFTHAWWPDSAFKDNANQFLDFQAAWSF